MTRFAGKKEFADVKGFTLVEVCIVTIISGMLFVAMYDLYAHYSQQQDKTLTLANEQEIQSQITTFLDTQNRYPCPADRTLTYNDPNFGKEIDQNADVTHINGCDVVAAVGLTPGNCYSSAAGITPAGTNGVGGVCMFDCSALNTSTTGCGDKTGVDFTAGHLNYKNVVLVGAVPITTINAALNANGWKTSSTSKVYDAWGSQIDYMVSYTLTRHSAPIANQGTEGTYKFDRGAITVHDENANDTAATVNNAHFALISHGPDRIGGYTKYGKMTTICGSHVPQSYANPIPSGPGGDDQNCSNTATLIYGIRNDSKSGMHYDDIVLVDTQTSGGLWKQLPASPDMVNINLGTVNVGTDGLVAPPGNTALNIGDPAGGAKGAVHADNSANPTAAGVKAAMICKKDGITACFPVKNLASPTPVITCPAGQVMEGISNGAQDCVATSFPAPADNTCGAGKWLVGIATDGSIICGIMP